MIWRGIVLLFGLTPLLFLKVEAGGKHDQGGKCPYSLIDIGALSTPVDEKGHSYGNIFEIIKDKISDAIGSLWPKDSSLDKVIIVPPDAVGYEDCPGEGSEPVTCDPSAPYRKFDGTCNNLDHPSWGKAGECQLRMMPPAYEGASGFRKSVVGGNPLPHPRELSNRVMSGADRPNPQLSSLSVFVGQFSAHDIIQTPTLSRNTVPCCPYDAVNRARAGCAPISIRPDDPYYSQFNVTCLPFERTNECTACRSSGKIQKINLATAAVDLNMVYGTSEEQADGLRTKDGSGKLKSDSSDGHGELLPRNVGEFSNFCVPSIFDKCFIAGDDRVDMHVGLTSLHTVFLREHNRLAEELKQLNPEWEEETLFQETRKIFGGVWQNIVYNEYLPPILGPRHMDHFGLWVGQSSRYNASVRPGMFIEVSTAGFRLHSRITRLTGLSGIRFFETYMNPELVRSGCVDGILRGASGVMAQMFDRNFEEDVNGQFVRLPGVPWGLDSSSIDILRGRDNGIPPYGQTVKFLTAGQTDIRSFDDLKRFMTPDNVKLLQKNYASVHDVDLWLGLQLEKHVSGSILGLNSATLTALQFHYLKYGDRFYFEHTGKGAPFTQAQIASLRQSSLARILCDNTNLKSIQKQPLLMPSHENPEVKCDQMVKMDLTPWKTKGGR